MSVDALAARHLSDEWAHDLRNLFENPERPDLSRVDLTIAGTVADWAAIPPVGDTHPFGYNRVRFDERGVAIAVCPIVVITQALNMLDTGLAANWDNPDVDLDEMEGIADLGNIVGAYIHGVELRLLYEIHLVDLPITADERREAADDRVHASNPDVLLLLKQTQLHAAADGLTP